MAFAQFPVMKWNEDDAHRHQVPNLGRGENLAAARYDPHGVPVDDPETLGIVQHLERARSIVAALK